jgi:hypothetical protein
MFALLLALPVQAQDYRFPAADEHYGYFYPTAYMDEGGRDWGCGDIYYSGHTGSDFGVGSWAGMDAGRRIVAAADGVVSSAHDGEYDRCSTGDCGEANYVVIDHANGRRTMYWHLKQWSVAVSAGQYVTCGTTLGYVGSSGYSTGPHIHFEVRESNGASGDPFDGACSAPPTYWISQGDYGGLPGNVCPSTGPCAQVAQLGCGQVISAANNAGGSTSSHAVYGCGSDSWSGSEIAYAFSTQLNEPVTIGLTGVGADLDLFVLSSDTCDGSGAVTCSTNSELSEEWVSFDAAAGATYTIVVDGWQGAVSGFNLSASCVGVPPDTGSPDTDVSDTSPASDSAVDVEPPAAVPGAVVPVDDVGCGCGGGGRVPGGASILALLAAVVGRRTARRSTA